MQELMNAVTFKYKSKDTKVVEAKAPEPTKDEILVKVIFSALDTALDPVVNKTMVGGLLHKFTTPLMCGWHFSGTVEKLGANVSISDFSIGNKVFGNLPYASHNGQGSLAEFITINENECAVLPESVHADIAAAATTEVSTALQALRDKGGLKVHPETQQPVLINGAGGGVGTAAVQIAKRMGAHVTAVCSTKDFDKVKQLGADVVIDRKKVSNIFSMLKKKQFDIIFDTPAALPAVKSLAYLKPRGKMVLTAMEPKHLAGYFRSKFARKGFTMLMVKSKKSDLELIGSWLEDGFQI